MKRKLLEDQLKMLGATFVAHRKGHDQWISKTGNLLWIPRHADVNQFTAEAILKQAAK